MHERQHLLGLAAQGREGLSKDQRKGEGGGRGDGVEGWDGEEAWTAGAAVMPRVSGVREQVGRGSVQELQGTSVVQGVS